MFQSTRGCFRVKIHFNWLSLSHIVFHWLLLSSLFFKIYPGVKTTRFRFLFCRTQVWRCEFVRLLGSVARVSRYHFFSFVPVHPLSSRPLPFVFLSYPLSFSASFNPFFFPFAPACLWLCMFCHFPFFFTFLTSLSLLVLPFPFSPLLSSLRITVSFFSFTSASCGR